MSNFFVEVKGSGLDRVGVKGDDGFLSRESLHIRAVTLGNEGIKTLQEEIDQFFGVGVNLPRVNFLNINPYDVLDLGGNTSTNRDRRH